MAQFDRRKFIEAAALLGITSAAGSAVSGAAVATAGHLTGGSPRLPDPFPAQDDITPEMIRQAERVLGLEFSKSQRILMVKNLTRNRNRYKALREMALPNHTIPSVVFDPHIGGLQPRRLESVPEIEWVPKEDVTRPESDDELAFLPVTDLAALLKARRVTSMELTELYLKRLEEYDPTLKAVVTLTAERARRQARAADAELAAGHWRGPLHGVPWGAKDLLSVSGYATTWGAEPYREQTISEDAEVVKRLDDAGAVLVAKLTLGALAMGDVWFDGKTRNPWNPEQGSSGSSAGPGSAVAAGLVGFAIGSETLGSIVSPSTRNGVTGLRPTYGRVGRSGAMTLSWTMDKLGPMCRSAEDCALVFAAIHGRDPRDPPSLTTPFAWPYPLDPRDLRVGYLAEAFESDYSNHNADAATLDVLEKSGIQLEPVAFPEHDTGAILLMLFAEAAAAFDELTLTGGTDEMVRQDEGAWPNSFRSSRFIPAVEYINASRARTRLMADMRSLFEDLDVIVMPTFRGGGLRITNLTGHPNLTLPNGFDPLEDDPSSPRRIPRSVSIIGDLHRDDAVLALGNLIQSNTDYHRIRPPIE